MKSTITNKDTNYSLYNSENYKKELDSNVNDVTKKYSELIIEYYKFIQENIKVSGTNISRFIIIRGLDKITNVFLHLLHYTKNLDLTYFHCQKSFYFYVEFVGQISDDEKMFLQLTSRDATTYVYKKTIFEINNELKKLNENMSPTFKEKLDVIKNYINIYQTYLLKIINYPKEYITNVKTILNIDKIVNLVEKLNSFNSVNNKLQIHLLEIIIDDIYHKIDNIDLFFEVNVLLVKKFLKNQDIIKIVKGKMNSDEFIEKINEPHEKFISWLLC
jgi:hypothetical protein